MLGNSTQNEIEQAFSNQNSDFDMEPNPNGEGEVLSEHDVITDKLLNVQTASIIGIVLFLIMFFSIVFSQGGSPDDSAGTVIMIWGVCFVVNFITDKKVSKNFAQKEYKNPCICSEKRFYMEAAKAVQDAGFQTEKGFFDSLVNGKGFMVIKPGLFDYTMVVTFDPQKNVFRVANKKIIGKADIEDFAFVVGNHLYSKNCPKVVSAIQKRLEHCANSVDRSKNEDLNSDASISLTGFAGDIAKDVAKELVQKAVVVVAVLAIIGIGWLFS